MSKTINWKDLLGRVGKTFVQAFIGAVSVDALIGVTDLETFKRIAAGLAVAGISAGISAVWNLAQAWAKEGSEERNDKS